MNPTSAASSQPAVFFSYTTPAVASNTSQPTVFSSHTTPPTASSTSTVNKAKSRDLPAPHYQKLLSAIGKLTHTPVGHVLGPVAYRITYQTSGSRYDLYLSDT